MISKARTKFIKSLQLKKYRVAEQAFVVEGTKSVLEVLDSDYSVLELIATEAFYTHHALASQKAETQSTASLKDLAALGTFRTNDGALAIVRTKPNTPFTKKRGYGLVLDGLNDPGNLGTIIRIADWFGLAGIIASPDVPDVYNPKVIAASKGSFSRVPVFYTPLPAFLREQQDPLWGADLQGENVHNFRFPAEGWIVLGSEAHGISPEVNNVLTGKITIPAYGKAESLNAGMAAAIICDNLRRSIGK